MSCDTSRIIARMNDTTSASHKSSRVAIAVATTTSTAQVLYDANLRRENTGPDMPASGDACALKACGRKTSWNEYIFSHLLHYNLLRV